MEEIQNEVEESARERGVKDNECECETRGKKR